MTAGETVYLIRATGTADPRVTWTVPADELRVRHGRKHRPVETRQSPIGPITRVEDAGEDRRLLEVSTAWESDEGPRPRYRVAGGGRRRMSATLRKSELKTHVRALAPEDVEGLEQIDAAIADLNAESRRLHAAREELVKVAWRRARKVLPMDLEDRIEATS